MMTRGRQSKISLELNAGEEVVLVVGGFVGASGEYRLNINRSALADGPCPDVRAELSSGVIHQGGADGRYVRRHGTCGGLGREVMIAWEAPQTDQYLFHTVGSTGAPVLYGLTECDGEELGCGNEFLGVDNQAGFSAEVLEGQTVVLVVDDLPPR